MVSADSPGYFLCWWNLCCSSTSSIFFSKKVFKTTNVLLYLFVARRNALGCKTYLQIQCSIDTLDLLSPIPLEPLPFQSLPQIYWLISFRISLLPFQDAVYCTISNCLHQFCCSVQMQDVFCTDRSVFLCCICVDVTTPDSSHVRLLGSRKSSSASSGLLIPVPANICVLRET